MSDYTVALFVHLLGVITLFGGIGLQQLGASRLRAATTVQEVRLWIGLLRPTGRMVPAAGALLLASGLYMARSWPRGTPFVVVGFLTLLVMAAVGAGVIGRWLAAIGRASAVPAGGPIGPDLARLIRGPAGSIALSAVNGAAFGVVWLMTNKPGWAASVSVVAGATALGGAIGGLLSRARSSRTAIAPSPAGEGAHVP
jgi:Predicted integral membrane protein (DUF2269)